MHSLSISQLGILIQSVWDGTVNLHCGKSPPGDDEAQLGLSTVGTSVDSQPLLGLVVL